MAAEFAKAGSIMPDGLLSGSPVTVTQGNASIMIGGDEAAYERVKPVPLAAANEMMNACRGLGIDANDFVVAHQAYRRLGGQS